MKLLREPLIHFLALGAVLFAVYALIDEPRDERTVVVSAEQVRFLEEEGARAMERPPTPQELDRLIEDFVREEIYYREALASGLDRDDSTIRRHLRQKLEFLTEDLADVEDPTEDRLRKFFDDNLDDYGEGVAFEEARKAVERDWLEARREAAMETFYRGLRERYTVVVETPAGEDGKPDVSEVRE